MLRNILNYYLKKYDSEATKRQCQFASCLYIYFKYRILKCLDQQSLTSKSLGFL